MSNSGRHDDENGHTTSKIAFDARAIVNEACNRGVNNFNMNFVNSQSTENGIEEGKDDGNKEFNCGDTHSDGNENDKSPIEMSRGVKYLNEKPNTTSSTNTTSTILITSITPTTTNDTTKSINSTSTIIMTTNSNTPTPTNDDYNYKNYKSYRATNNKICNLNNSNNKKQSNSDDNDDNNKHKSGLVCAIKNARDDDMTSSKWFEGGHKEVMEGKKAKKEEVSEQQQSINHNIKTPQKTKSDFSTVVSQAEGLSGEEKKRKKRKRPRSCAEVNNCIENVQTQEMLMENQRLQGLINGNGKLGGIAGKTFGSANECQEKNGSWRRGGVEGYADDGVMDLAIKRKKISTIETSRDAAEGIVVSATTTTDGTTATAFVAATTTTSFIQTNTSNKDRVYYLTSSENKLTKISKALHRSQYHQVQPAKQTTQQHSLLPSIQRSAVIKTFVCTFPGCDKRFKEAKHLKVHQMQHTDSKPLSCHLCPYSCRQRNSMNWHMKSKHHYEKNVSSDGKTKYFSNDRRVC